MYYFNLALAITATLLPGRPLPPQSFNQAFKTCFFVSASNWTIVPQKIKNQIAYWSGSEDSIVRELSAQFVHLKRATQSDIAQQPRATEVREKAFGLPLQQARPSSIPVKRLLGQTVHDSLDELKDPYILSTLLRSANRPKELIKRPQVSQHELLRSIKLSSRRTQPAHELIGVPRASPKPGLQAVALEDRTDSLLGQICGRVDAQFNLSLTERDNTLCGGRLKAHCHMWSQAVGLQAILNPLLLSPPALAVDFGLVLELIDGALARLGPDILRSRSWRLILLSTLWTGHAGLECCNG
ncbi:hypothetical protein PTTG_03400 [Puccinia triticina 1-1 BBBD Race 1]|uniref:Uncharacterized protein n=1 Tax=Puccinia triticina (isolate 1-1 / race 1 (BBBD)) TaxID=630390 RepID=A0A180GTM9_PUCT1|nr:hypothetical protein PTTG_03400 [Puccinia triticina 1-1 BBBD Race 1]